MTMLTLSNIRNFGVLLLLMLFGCGETRDDSRVAGHTAEDSCHFRTGSLKQSYCRVSIYKLVTNPEVFVGKPIYTVGYVEKGSDGSLGLSPSPDVFEAGDMMSCIVMDYVLGVNEAVDGLQEEGLYAVSIAGEFSEPVRGLCSGRLSRAVVGNVRVIKRY